MPIRPILPLNLPLHQLPCLNQILRHHTQMKYISRHHNKRHPLRRLLQPLGGTIWRCRESETTIRLVVLVHDLEKLVACIEPLLFVATHAHVPGKVHADACVKGAEPDDVDIGDFGENGVEIVYACIPC